MPIRKIENPEQFRSNIRKKLEEFFETKDAINLEKGIHNWAIKEATNKNLGLLRAINGGKVNGYNSGGMIPGVQYLNEGDIVQARRYIEYIR